MAQSQTAKTILPADYVYATTEPITQLTVDIFKGEWFSRLPGEIESGRGDFCNDQRIVWANEVFNLSGKSVLELGPLEGAHTYMIHDMGTQEIVSAEGNSRAYLKCLVVTELFK
jgi:hypothetical protein